MQGTVFARVRRQRTGLTCALCAAVLVTFLLGGCSSERHQARAGQAPTTGRIPPKLGGPYVAPAHLPAGPMNRIEKPIAARLAEQARAQGLRLQILDCPPWDTSVPGRLRCMAYLDGIPTPVRVHLAAADDGSIAFEATLGHGVVATRKLVQELSRHGYTHVDCGNVAAYPSRVGLRVVCQVSHDGDERYVAATVTDRSGGMTISDY
jgi:hypothetical protein